MLPYLENLQPKAINDNSIQKKILCIIECDKYKKNFSKLACFEGTKHFIINLDNKVIDTLKNTTSKLNSVNNIIQNFMSNL